MQSYVAARHHAVDGSGVVDVRVPHAAGRQCGGHRHARQPRLVRSHGLRRQGHGLAVVGDAAEPGGQQLESGVGVHRGHRAGGGVAVGGDRHVPAGQRRRQPRCQRERLGPQHGRAAHDVGGGVVLERGDAEAGQLGGLVQGVGVAALHEVHAAVAAVHARPAAVRAEAAFQVADRFQHLLGHAVFLRRLGEGRGDARVRLHGVRWHGVRPRRGTGQAEPEQRRQRQHRPGPSPPSRVDSSGFPSSHGSHSPSFLIRIRIRHRTWCGRGAGLSRKLNKKP